MKKNEYIPPEKMQAVYLAVYDMRGGPIPAELERYLSNVASALAEKFPDLAISTSVE